MKVACVGGGPAGLYLSILLKRQDPTHDVTVYERDPEGSTYGWGVTYWRGLLDRLQEHDPDSARAVEEHSVRWRDGVAHVGDLATRHHGDEGFGIGRHRLLALLAARARELGVHLEYEHPVTAADPPAADLVVAADGAGSALRGHHAGHFGTEITGGRNHYVWLGTTKVFDAFTFAFTETDHGWIWAYGYGYGPEGSTCVVECAPGTWTGLGLDRADEAEGLVLLEKLFADVLDGHPLTARSSGRAGTAWPVFRTVTNRTWSRGNLVLLGDAAHTTHYSVGAGTTLALEDAMALATALREPGLPFRAPSPTTNANAGRPCCRRRARPGSAPSGTRTCPATSACPRSRCSPCSVSATRRCCRISRPACTTGSTGRPAGSRRCAGSSAAWDRWSRARSRRAGSPPATVEPAPGVPTRCPRAADDRLTPWTSALSAGRISTRRWSASAPGNWAPTGETSTTRKPSRYWRRRPSRG